jgi:two-component system sensor histidine kinase PilS (NtrC family)
MSPQLIEKIFEPFQSQFEGGTGLGLAIVYQIVQAHEGKVWARSKVGQGSVFVLKLRRLAQAVSTLQQEPTGHSSHLETTAAVAVAGGARG